MDRLLTINGKPYKAAEFDINFICDLEDDGIKLEEIDGKMFHVVRQYVATSMGVDPRTAGVELREHQNNGGSMEDVMTVMTEMMNESGFFRQKQENEKKTDSASKGKKKTASEEVTS